MISEEKIYKPLFSDLVSLYEKHTIEGNELSEEEFFEQIIYYLVIVMKNKQTFTNQYKNNPNVLLEGFYKFIELK